MRMAADQLLADVLCHFVEIERAAFSGKLAVENDLEKQIAELFEQLLVIVPFDGIEQFIDFLNRVPAESLVRLFTVPWATGFAAQPSHDRDELVERGLLF